jgi:hypothetical protein
MLGKFAGFPTVPRWNQAVNPEEGDVRTVAICKVYEIQGPDPNATAGALRCLRDAADELDVDGARLSICEDHRGNVWHLFANGGWVYAVALDESTS